MKCFLELHLAHIPEADDPEWVRKLTDGIALQLGRADFTCHKNKDFDKVQGPCPDYRFSK